MKRFRMVIAALAVAIAGTVVGVTPAHAIHDNDFGHWNQPPLVVTKAGFAFDSIIQDAAYYWQDTAFYRGYYPPLPHREGSSACGPDVGRIVICLVPPGNSWLGGGQGKIWPTEYGDGSRHISSMVIYIDDSLTGALRQAVMRHEFGHALGLGHYTNGGHPATCGLMNEGGCNSTPYATYPDFHGIFSWQPYRYANQPFHSQH